MDPVQTHRMILSLLEDSDDFMHLFMCCDDLLGWLRNGGFKEGLTPIDLNGKTPGPTIVAMIERINRMIIG